MKEKELVSMNRLSLSCSWSLPQAISSPKVSKILSCMTPSPFFYICISFLLKNKIKKKNFQGIEHLGAQNLVSQPSKVVLLLFFFYYSAPQSSKCSATSLNFCFVSSTIRIRKNSKHKVYKSLSWLSIESTCLDIELAASRRLSPLQPGHSYFSP